MMSENPYNERHEEYRARAWKQDYHNAEVFFQDATYCSGEKKGWDEGVMRYFNFNSENDCADTLYTYLARLWEGADKQFGHSSPVAAKIFDLLLDLGKLELPSDTAYAYRFQKGKIEEHQYVDGVWVQPHSWADELH